MSHVPAQSLHCDGVGWRGVCFHSLPIFEVHPGAAWEQWVSPGPHRQKVGESSLLPALTRFVLSAEFKRARASFSLISEPVQKQSEMSLGALSLAL